MEKKEDGKFKPGSGKYVSNKFILKLGKKEAAKVVMDIISKSLSAPVSIIHLIGLFSFSPNFVPNIIS